MKNQYNETAGFRNYMFWLFIYLFLRSMGLSRTDAYVAWRDYWSTDKEVPSDEIRSVLRKAWPKSSGYLQSLGFSLVKTASIIYEFDSRSVDDRKTKATLKRYVDILKNARVSGSVIRDIILRYDTYLVNDAEYFITNLSMIDDKTLSYLINLHGMVYRFLGSEELANEIQWRVFDDAESGRYTVDHADLGAKGYLYLNKKGELWDGLKAAEFRREDKIDDLTIHKEDWTAFECQIESPEDLKKFRDNLVKLHPAERKFLRELPMNLDYIFGVNTESYDLLHQTERDIIERIVANDETSSIEWELCLL